MSTPRVLLLGGHGKVALLMTPLFLKRSWHVTSVIRDPAQKDEILKLGENLSGKIEVLIDNIEDVKSEEHAAKVLDKVKPNYVVWSAGAGGKGGSERTYAIDRDAAKYYISASFNSSPVTKFLMVSYLGSRRKQPPWWSSEEMAASEKVNREILPHYYQAKLAADEHLAALAKQRADGGDSKFQAINLRPGTLSDEAPTGKVALGHTSSRGKVSRADVADVAARLLERDDTRGWIDLLSGEEPVDQAIERIVKEKIDCIEGE